MFFFDVAVVTSQHAPSACMLVTDDEICRAVLKAVQGIEVNDETLGVGIIDKVASGGHFLAEKHTLRNFKDVLFFPEISDRQSYDAWKKAGGKSMVKGARERAEEILKEHWPTPLDKDGQKEIFEIIRRAEKELAKSIS